MANLYRSNLKSDTSVGDVSLVLTTPPTKTIYMQGDTFDPSGIVVTATMGDFSGDVTDKCTFNPSILGLVGTQTIRITYMGQTITTDVTVSDVSISVTTPPTYSEHPTNSQLNLTGLVITATDGSSSKNVASECTFSPAIGTVLDTEGTTTVTATYFGHTTTFNITVTDLVSVSVTTPPTKTIYREGEQADYTGLVVTAEYSDHTGVVTGLCTISPAEDDILYATTEEITISLVNETTTTPVYIVGKTLDDTSWKTIQAIGAKGIGSQYFNIGDRKKIRISGRIGSQISFSNYQFLVTVAHFNYRNQNGVYFFGFSNVNPNNWQLYDNVITDPNGQKSYTSGKYINFNHWGAYYFGGWKGCDLRYDILGSTNVAPSGYGSATTSGRVGYDATSTCATNPVPDTLMAALPSDLRACMAPITIYSENSSTATHNAQATVTASIDYLPYLAEFEVMGKRTYANTYEKNYQQQLAYFQRYSVAADITNDLKTYRYDTYGAYGRATRSAYYSNNAQFCGINSGGGMGYYSVAYTTGLHCWFRIA